MISKRDMSVYARKLTDSSWFWMSIIVFFFCFSRLTVLRIPGLSIDSESYLAVAEMALQGNWPDFTIRPAVYPLILALNFALGGDMQTMILLQSALFLLAVLTFYYLVQPVMCGHRWLLACALVLFVMHPELRLWETSIIPSGVYGAFLLFYFAFLCDALCGEKLKTTALASLFAGLAITTHPACFFLVVLSFLVCTAVWIARRNYRWCLALLLPMFALLLTQKVYNGLTSGAADVSAFAERNLLATTRTFWEPGKNYDYPDYILEEIARTRASITPEDREILEHSWKPLSLMKAYHHYYTGWLSVPKVWEDHGNTYIQGRPMFRALIANSIRAHPGNYARFVYANLLVCYMNTVIGRDPIWWGYEQVRFRWMRGDADFLRGYRQYLIDQWDEKITSLFSVYGPSLEEPDPLLTGYAGAMLSKPYDFFERVRAALSSVYLWRILQLLAFMYVLVAFLRTRCYRPGHLFIGALIVGEFGAFLLVSMVEIALERYTYKMEFAMWVPACWVLAVGINEVTSRMQLRSAPAT